MSTHNISYQYKKENRLNKIISAAMGFFCLALKNAFEMAVIMAISVRATEVLL